MTETDRKDIESEPAGANEVAAETGGVPATDTEQQLGALCAVGDEVFDRMQRTAADFQNFRRRSQEQLEDQVRFRMEHLFQDVITVLDSMDAAFAGAAEAAAGSAAQAILDGFEQIRSLLRSTLERNGLKRIPTAGEAFDPRWHEVLFAEETAEVAPDTVMEELRAGYLLRDRVLRPAQVKVSKAPAEEPGEGDSPGEAEGSPDN